VSWGSNPFRRGHGTPFGARKRICPANNPPNFPPNRSKLPGGVVWCSFRGACAGAKKNKNGPSDCFGQKTRNSSFFMAGKNTGGGEPGRFSRFSKVIGRKCVFSSKVVEKEKTKTLGERVKTRGQLVKKTGGAGNRLCSTPGKTPCPVELFGPETGAWARANFPSLSGTIQLPRLAPQISAGRNRGQRRWPHTNSSTACPKNRLRACAGGRGPEGKSPGKGGGTKTMTGSGGNQGPPRNFEPFLFFHTLFTIPGAKQFSRCGLVFRPGLFFLPVTVKRFLGPSAKNGFLDFAKGGLVSCLSEGIHFFT